MTRISVIIVNYNAGEKISRCLAHLDLQSFRDFDTIIVDNGSTDGSIAIVRERFPTVRLIEAGSNLGFAAANNLAAGSASGEWLALLNPDAYADADWLLQLCRASEKYPWADAFGSAQICANDLARLDGAGDVYHVLGVAYRGGFGQPVGKLPDDGVCIAPCAAAAMYRREVFIALGGFDERFFCYGEDVDLGLRLALAGGRSVQIAAARVLHEGSGISGRYSDFTVYHGNRNRIWMTYKCMPGAFYWTLLPARLIFDLYLFFRAISIGKTAAYARAIRDGYGRLGGFRTDRRRLQASRSLSLAEFAGLVAWSPLSMLMRRTKLKSTNQARR